MILIFLAFSCKINDEIESLEPNTTSGFSNPYAMARFPEGFEEITKFISKNFNSSQMQEALEGKVYLEFIVNADGSLSDVKVIRGLNEIIDEEAVKVFNLMPKWEPATKYGIPMKVKQTSSLDLSLINNDY